MNPQILDLTVFLCFDFSQAELRMLAEISGDPLLIRQFQEAAEDPDPNNPAKDIHCIVGNTLTGWPLERIKKEKNLRKLVKNMQFGLVYGKQKSNMYEYVVTKIREIDGVDADLTGITKQGVEDCVDRYFQKYSKVAQFMQDMQRQVEELGYVESIFGFRRDIFEDDARDTFTGNQAINTPIQSSAHGLLLIALALLYRKPRTYNLLQTPVMEVHDALDFFVKVKDLSGAYAQGRHLLEVAVVEYVAKHFRRRLGVPLKAEASVGFCLGSQIEYTGEPANVWLPLWRQKHLEVEEKSWKELAKYS